MTFDLAGKEDYDRWIEVGGVGWNELFPYFKKVRSLCALDQTITQTDRSAN